MRRFFNSLQSQEIQREKNRIRSRNRRREQRKKLLRVFEKDLIEKRLKELEAIEVISTTMAFKADTKVDN